MAEVFLHRVGWRGNVMECFRVRDAVRGAGVSVAVQDELADVLAVGGPVIVAEQWEASPFGRESGA